MSLPAGALAKAGQEKCPAFAAPAAIVGSGAMYADVDLW